VVDFYQGKKVVVTGAAGFIGSHLVEVLVAAGATVTALDNLHSGVMSNLQAVRDRICFQRVDVRDGARLTSLLEGADLVFHLAGNALVPYSVEDPSYDFESNVIGTFHLLRCLRERHIGRVVFSSSAAVYGIPCTEAVEEGHRLEPVSPYGASKLAAERLGVGWARTYGLEFVIARIYNTYGPRQRKYVMFDLLNKLHRDPGHLEVLGDGQQVRDYSYVSDTVQALLLLGQRGQPAEAYNVAGGNPTRIADLVPVLVAAMGLRNVPVTYTGTSWRGDIPVMVGDIRKLKNLGFTPRISLEQGIVALVRWLSEEVWSGPPVEVAEERKRG